MNDKNYTVGYKKTPRQTQFQKGQSGNPSGRRKKSKNSGQILIDELYSPIFITEHGKRKRITKLGAMIKRATHDSMNGKWIYQTL